MHTGSEFQRPTGRHIPSIALLAGIATCTAFVVGNETVDNKGATVSEAARIVKFMELLVPDGVRTIKQCTIANLEYEVSGTVQSVYQRQKAQLISKKWHELPRVIITDVAASSIFSKGAFKISMLIVAANKPDFVLVYLINHGNIDIRTLQLPHDTQLQSADSLRCTYLLGLPVAQSKIAVHRLIVAQGWQPHGVFGDTVFFKQNAIRLNAEFASAPGFASKTLLILTSEQLAVDIPYPATAEQLYYNKLTQQLRFETRTKTPDVVDFYRLRLHQAGWTPTTAEAVQVDSKVVWVFANAQNDTLRLEAVTAEDKSQVTLKYHSGLDVSKL